MSPEPSADHYTIVFADIAGSTQLYELLGDEAAQRQIADRIALIRDVTLEHQGTVIKTIGDEVMSRFSSATDAVLAVRAMQEANERINPTNISPLLLRIGLHYGPALLRENDLFGDAVNIAARMASVAKAGQIITTADTIRMIPPLLAEQARKFDVAQIKGKQEPLVMYQILWQRDNVTAFQSTGSLRTALQHGFLRLRYQGIEKLLTAETGPVTLGRDASCEILVPSTYSSRQHARIEYRRSKFVLIDQSTNGTYVKTGNHLAVYLRREEAPLVGDGVISLGEAIVDDNPHLLHFTSS